MTLDSNKDKEHEDKKATPDGHIDTQAAEASAPEAAATSDAAVTETDEAAAAESRSRSSTSSVGNR